MTPEAASFRDGLGETLAEAWRLMARGVADRRHGFHHPAVATVGLDGRPRVRTVILRGADAAARALRFHTDVRSAKVAELAREPRASLLFYDAGAKAQVRIEGRATVHADDAVADAAWAGSRPMSRACYGTMPAPGGAIPAGDAFVLPEPESPETAAGRANFRAVILVAESLEWLHLGHGGHRRALYDWGGGPPARWLVP
jgi:hypothetical protein